MNRSLTQSNETSHEPKAFFIAFLIYSVLLALLFFWEIKFNPPVEPLGVEVNFGMDDVGSGKIQTTNKASNSPNDYDVKPPNSDSDPKPQKPQPKPVEPKPVVKAVKTPIKAAPEKIITTKTESKVVMKEVTTPPKTNPKPVDVPSKTTNIKPTPEPVKSTPTPPAPPARTADAGSLFGKGKSSGGGVNGTSGTRDGEGGNNNGDNKSGVGDKGSPNGDLGPGAFDGNRGKGGTGSSISGFSGWKRGKLNLPNDNSDETGKIVFKVKVDDQGNVISITAIEKTVSPSVVEFYKNQIARKMNSILDSDGNPPPISEGTITININN
jgi:periplasmic protein TonB